MKKNYCSYDVRMDVEKLTSDGKKVSNIYMYKSLKDGYTYITSIKKRADYFHEIAKVRANKKSADELSSILMQHLKDYNEKSLIKKSDANSIYGRKNVPEQAYEKSITTQKTLRYGYGYPWNKKFEVKLYDENVIKYYQK